MAGSDSYNYLVKQYIKMGLLSEDEKKDSGSRNTERKWDPFIYPDSGYIPPCSVCKGMYDEYIVAPTKPATVVWPHYICGCLWSEFYQDKILKINNKVVFVKAK